MKINVWHIIEQRTINASIDHWRAPLKARTYAEGIHFKYMRWNSLCRRQRNSIPREHFLL